MKQVLLERPRRFAIGPANQMAQKRSNVGLETQGTAHIENRVSGEPRST